MSAFFQIFLKPGMHPYFCWLWVCAWFAEIVFQKLCVCTHKTAEKQSNWVSGKTADMGGHKFGRELEHRHG